jgi:DHA1 family tetracycline resistance protein-like MFS transporter
VLGPLLGGLVVSLPVSAEWQLRLPFLVAAGFSTVAWILVLTKLPESRPGDGGQRSKARVLSVRGLADTLQLPDVGKLVLLGSLNVLAFAALEGTFGLYLRERMQWSERGAMFGFAFLGLVTAFVQGGLIRRLVPRFGESKLIIVGLFLSLIGFIGLGVATTTAVLMLALVAIGLGQGCTSPSISGLLSRVTPSAEQGAVFGTFVSAQTLARLVNYYVSNKLLGQVDPSAPFWEAAIVAAVALIIGGLALRRGVAVVDERVEDQVSVA